VPLEANGHLIGAIGLSGGQSNEDGQCATAGANAIKTL